MEKKCISCNKNISCDNGSVIFDCPKCGKHKIIRCASCKVNSIKYTCPECKFEGPN